MQKSTLMWLFILIVGLGLIIFGLARKAHAPEATPQTSGSTSPTVSPTANATASLSPAPKQKTSIPKPLPSVPLSLVTKLTGVPASCTLKGGVDFLQANLYDNKDALFRYKGVDNPARLIQWRSVPQDDIRVGPNLFNQMPLPDGTSLLTIALPDQPKARHYDLYAAMTYGRLVNGEVKVMQIDCAGHTSVDLKF